ncbi:MAG: sortase [Patescibacteria group bacterium]|nr:sortase [Patescibacteria group bacterium]
MRYRYVKYHHHPRMRRSLIVSFFFLGTGGLLLLWVGWPIVSFHLVTAPLFPSFVSPLGSKKTSSSELVHTKDVNATQQDFTNPNMWFPLKPQKKVETNVTAYTLTIPKLRIYDALVIIGGEDLNEGIIHYGGTALPGENGNGALFGHSVLPQFFDPKNYKTIFSTLPTLKIGDDIFLNYDGITYRYRVESMKVTTPEDLSMLEQDYSDSYITLVTCVPPGTYWQRLHVRARLIKI